MIFVMKKLLGFAVLSTILLTSFSYAGKYCEQKEHKAGCQKASAWCASHEKECTAQGGSPSNPDEYCQKTNKC